MKKFNLSFFALLVLMASSFTQVPPYMERPPFIEVSAYVDSLVTPNQLFIRIVLNEKDSKDQAAFEQTEEKMVKALNTIDINTGRVSAGK